MVIHVIKEVVYFLLLHTGLKDLSSVCTPTCVLEYGVVPVLVLLLSSLDRACQRWASR